MSLSEIEVRMQRSGDEEIGKSRPSLWHLVRSPKELTRAEVVRAANNFAGRGKGQNGRSLWVKESFQLARLFLRLRVFLRMTRPNSHQAVEILRRLGFETRYSRSGRKQGQTRKRVTGDRGRLGSILESFRLRRRKCRRRVGSRPRRFVYKC